MTYEALSEEFAGRTEARACKRSLSPERRRGRSAEAIA